MALRSGFVDGAARKKSEEKKKILLWLYEMRPGSSLEAWE
jgi:hypothetical protein